MGLVHISAARHGPRIIGLLRLAASTQNEAERNVVMKSAERLIVTSGVTVATLKAAPSSTCPWGHRLLVVLGRKAGFEPCGSLENPILIAGPGPDVLKMRVMAAALPLLVLGKVPKMTSTDPQLMAEHWMMGFVDAIEDLVDVRQPRGLVLHGDVLRSEIMDAATPPPRTQEPPRPASPPTATKSTTTPSHEPQPEQPAAQPKTAGAIWADLDECDRLQLQAVAAQKAGYKAAHYTPSMTLVRKFFPAPIRLESLFSPSLSSLLR